MSGNSTTYFCNTFNFQMFHDNSTKIDKSEFRVPLTGFTHTYTPNDFKINDDDVMDQLGKKRLHINVTEGRLR